MPGSDPPTSILGLNQYTNGDDWDYNDVNADNQRIDRIPVSFCTSATRPNTDLFSGRRIYETDTGREYVWNGATWLLVSENWNAIWVDFSSTIKAWQGTSTTPAEVTNKTVGTCKYKLVGKTCFAVAEVTYNVATTNGCGIDLPFIAKHRTIIGSGGLFGATFPADQTGIAYMPGARDKVIVVAYTAGFRDAAASATQRYNVCYEIQ